MLGIPYLRKPYENDKKMGQSGDPHGMISMENPQFYLVVSGRFFPEEILGYNQFDALF